MKIYIRGFILYLVFLMYFYSYLFVGGDMYILWCVCVEFIE